MSTAFWNSRAGGSLRVEPLEDGRHHLSVWPKRGHTVSHREWVTSYPLPLVLDIHATKDLNVCDEIMREESPRYVERRLRHEVLDYVEAKSFAGKRVLDFGCGSGASPARVEPHPAALRARRCRDRSSPDRAGAPSCATLRRRLGAGAPVAIARDPAARARPVRFHHVQRRVRAPAAARAARVAAAGVAAPAAGRRAVPQPDAASVLAGGNPYDRRPPVHQLSTGSRRPRVARRFAKRIAPTESWSSLLRRGIRGGTVREIMGILGGSARAELLPPRVGDRIDLWHRTLSRRHALLKRLVWMSLKLGRWVSGREITPRSSAGDSKALIGLPALVHCGGVPGVASDSNDARTAGKITPPGIRLDECPRCHRRSHFISGSHRRYSTIYASA